MPGPTLSPLERARIADAAKLAQDGHLVRWRVGVDRLSYVVGQRQQLVFSLSTSRQKFLALCLQAEQEFKRLTETKVA